MLQLFYHSLTGAYISRHQDALSKAQEANKLLTHMLANSQKENISLECINDSLVISYFNIGVEYEHLHIYDRAISSYTKVLSLLTNSSSDLYKKVINSLRECIHKKSCLEESHKQRKDIRMKHSICEYLKNTSMIDARDINPSFCINSHKQSILNKTYTSHDSRQSNTINRVIFSNSN